MHLKFGYFVLYTSIYQFTGEKKSFHVKLSMRNGECETSLYARAPPTRLCRFEFGRKVILVDFLLIKNIKYGENKPNRTR